MLIQRRQHLFVEQRLPSLADDAAQFVHAHRRLLRDTSRALFEVLRQGAPMKWTVAIVVTCFFAVVMASCATTDPQRGEVAQADVAELFTLLHRQLGGCWAIPVGAKAAATVRFSLNRDGSLAGAPTLVKTTTYAQSQAVAESALLAVQRCAPFKLPADKYELWKEVEVVFDPRDVFVLR